MSKPKFVRENELPDWFNAKRYEQLHTLDSLGWYIQICSRRYIYKAFSEDPEIFQCDSAISTQCRELFNHIKTSPLLTKDDIPSLTQLWMGLLQISKPESVRSEPITAMNTSDLIKVLVSADRKKTKYVLSLMDILQEKLEVTKKLVTLFKKAEKIRPAGKDYYGPFVDHSGKRPENTIGGYPPLPNHTLPFMVNMSFDDSAIISSFKEHLEKARNESGVIRAYKKEPHINFIDWIVSRSLEYTDLRIWELMVGKKIPPRLARKLIDPTEGGEHPEASFKNTTKKHSFMFTSEDDMGLYKRLLLEARASVQNSD